MGARIFIYLNNEELKQLVQKFGTDIKSDLTKQMKQYLLTTPTQQTTQTKDELFNEYYKLRNEKLKLDIQIKERELAHWETFGKEPTPQAKQAIIQGAKQAIFFDIAKHCEIYLDRLDGYHAQCKHCDYFTPMPRDYKEQALADIEPHIKKHSEAWR
jgi:hypothetical protein